MESPPWALSGGSATYPAEQSRRAMFAWAARTAANDPGIIAGGLLSPTDMQLSAAVSGLVVNISVGECLIGGTEGGVQGGYYARNASTSSVTLATANATNPRIDAVVGMVGDGGYTLPSGSTSGAVTLVGVTGTPTAGATLSNLNGAPATPASSLLLGYVLVPAAATSLTGGDIGNVATTVEAQAGVPYLITGGGSGTSLTNNVNESIPIGSITAGHQIGTSGGGFVISRPGLYQAFVVTQFNTGSSGYVQTMLAQNGATQPSERIPPSAANNIAANAAALFKCAVGDGIGVQAYQNSGTTMPSVSVSSASIFYVGAS